MCEEMVPVPKSLVQDVARALINPTESLLRRELASKLDSTWRKDAKSKEEAAAKAAKAEAAAEPAK